jgi:cysteine desulfurase/selenocysteine lyase
MDAKKIREDFPLLQNKKVIYFDSACTSLKPRQVIEAQRQYYEEISGCAGRSAHFLAKRTSELVEEARERVAKFVNASPDEVIWTKNATEGINLAIRSLDYSARKKVVASPLEHHSVLLPIMEQQRRKIVQMGLLECSREGEILEERISEKIGKDAALVAIHHTTNTTGMRSPLGKIIKIAHENGALVLVDGAQGVPHAKVDFKRLDADFLAFSGHKMLGPTGIGCLVGKRHLLEKLDTFIVGGETIEQVSLQNGVIFKKPPKRFEAGIQNYAGAIGLAAACSYLGKIGMENVEGHERKLAGKLIEAIRSVPGAQIYGPLDASRCALAAFNLKGVPPHQVAIMCDSLAQIALRSGTFCAQPAMELLGAKNGAVRASLYIYNTEEEIGIFAEALQKISALGR